MSHARSQARLAQSAERKALNLVVVGSSPTVGVFTGSGHVHMVVPIPGARASVHVCVCVRFWCTCACVVRVGVEPVILFSKTV